MAFNTPLEMRRLRQRLFKPLPAEEAPVPFNTPLEMHRKRTRCGAAQCFFQYSIGDALEHEGVGNVYAWFVFQYSIGDARCDVKKLVYDALLSILHWRCATLRIRSSSRRLMICFQYSIGDALPRVNGIISAGLDVDFQYSIGDADGHGGHD